MSVSYQNINLFFEERNNALNTVLFLTRMMLWCQPIIPTLIKKYLSLISVFDIHSLIGVYFCIEFGQLKESTRFLLRLFVLLLINAKINTDWKHIENNWYKRVKFKTWTVFFSNYKNHISCALKLPYMKYSWHEF